MIDRKINAIYIFLLFAGLLFIIFTINPSIKVLDNKNKIYTTGIITKIKEDYSGDSHETYVTYEVNGRSYTSIIRAYSSTFYVGKEIKIYYQKDNPNEIGVKSLDLLILLFPFMGSMFAIFGGVNIYKVIKEKKTKNKLLKTGLKIEAHYVESIKNKYLTVLNHHPYYIICKYINSLDNKEYTFKSRRIWQDPSSYIKDANITIFTVYVDKNNMNKYYVDTDILE